MPLFAVEGDNNSHGGGSLLQTASKTYIEGRLVAIEVTNANPDNLCPIASIHCNPATSSYSSSVFIEGHPVHRVGDSRICGAVTVETNCHKTYCG